MIQRIGEVGETGALSPSRNGLAALQSIIRGMIPATLPIRHRRILSIIEPNP
ncbi:MAG: hypothetical protein J6R67_10510 [Treponema sp.]|nr:hypothetical protein [Treponema sp.]